MESEDAVVPERFFGVRRHYFADGDVASDSLKIASLFWDSSSSIFLSVPGGIGPSYSACERLELEEHRPEP